MEIRKTDFIIVLLILFSLSFIPAAAGQDGPRSICVFTSADLSASEDSGKYQDLITEALEVEVGSGGYEVVPRAMWRDLQKMRELPAWSVLLGQYALSLAAELDADFAITGFYQIDEDRLLLEIKWYDVNEGRLIAGVMRRGTVGLTMYNLINDAMSAILQRVNTQEVLPARFSQPPENLYEFEIESPDEGADVSLGGIHPAGRVVEGSVTILSPPGHRTPLEISKDGYHAREQIITTIDEGGVPSLDPLIKETVWGAEILYTYGQAMGLGFGLRYYILSDSLFVSCDDYFYLQPPAREDLSYLFHNDIRVLAGKYLFFGPGSLFRMGISTGFGLVVTGEVTPGTGADVDIYWNAANGWVEYNAPHWIVYLQVEGKYALDIGPNLLGGNWFQVQGGSPPVTLGLVRKW